MPENITTELPPIINLCHLASITIKRKVDLQSELLAGSRS